MFVLVLSTNLLDFDENIVLAQYFQQGLHSYLGKEGLVDLHTFIGSLRENVSSSVPAVADGRVGVGHTTQEHRPLVVELLFRFTYTLMNRHHRVVQI